MTAQANLESLLGPAAPRDGRPALVFKDGEQSYADLCDAAEGLARRLEAAAGPLAGAPVAIVAPTSPALVVALLAAWEAGAVAVPLSARLREYELAQILADAEPVAVVSVEAHGGYSFAPLLARLSGELPSLRACLMVDAAGEVRDERPTGQGSAPEPIGPEIGAILYTSGTTGAPKGALVAHACLLQEARALAEVIALGPQDVTALVIPASHAFGLACLLAALGARSGALLVDSAVSLDPLLDAMDRVGATVLPGSPALFAGLLKARSEGVQGLRAGFVAGASCPPELIERMDEQGATILNLYGMTEIGAAASCRPQDPPQARYTTVGRPLPGYEFRAVAGEIQVSGPYVTPGYHRAPEATAAAFDGGWLRTGDLGEIDEEGRVRILGRAKEVLHVGGFNVFPAEIEGFLLTHPDVVQAAVVGVPHERMGEAPAAFVVARPDSSLTPQELRRFARGRIAGYKVPPAIEIVPEMPLLSSGKPDRQALLERARRSAGEPAHA